LEAGYGAALVAVGLATLAALGLGLGAEAGAFAPFLVAVTAIALRYGVGPALLTIAASAVAAYVWLLAPLAALAFDPAALRRLAFFRLGVFAGAGGLITVFAEIHRQALLELERQRCQFRTFTTSDDVGLQVIDHDGRIVWADNGSARLLGYEPEEWVGSDLARFCADAELGRSVQTRLAAGAAIENLRTALLRKDGTTQDVLLNSNSLLGDARAPGSGVLVAVLPFKSPVAAVDCTKLAVSALLERRRQMAAAPHPEGDHS
jgi:PAS domain S-box-containing protein